ncbi:MAG TPA: energy transducer TonB [Terriglobales bacterium]|nr:energy transducer TonB [Terriglobales bacterium]
MKIFIQFFSYVSLLVGVSVGQATLSAANVSSAFEQIATAPTQPEHQDSGCNTLPREKDVFRREDGVLPPKVKYAPDPEYPKGARKGKLQGRVFLCATVDPEGRVSDVVVVKTLTAEFDQSAAKTVRKWKSKPGSKDGKSVAVQVNVVVDFHPSD